ncbi:Ig-like domain-containing protein [Aeromonas veronii]|uniref:Ig-like domain-containing protein n=1 Tax=Aeromonas veronii TaxID=654 RepID=UPI002B47F936|nr:Ig-like domain-containing protein [Aeromonas veronii]
MKQKWFYLLIWLFVLIGCGGGEGDNSQGGSAPATAEVLAPQARDSYDQLLTANQPNASNDVSLRDRVSDPQGLALRLLSVQPLTSQCQPPVVNSEALSFRVDNGSADACTYAYTIENVPTNGATPKRTQATSYVVVSAAASPAMLPILSHTAVVNETIAIDLASELGGYFPTGFTLQPEVIVLGSGTALADPASNTINYTAAAVPGITRLIYSYLSADGTEVRAGAIDVSVSKSADGMPLAENFPGPEDVLPGAVVTVDVKDHISDPNGDPLQLTDAYAFDATVSATDATSLTNTRFDFVADKPGSYDVSYYVTDHNGGYAIGVVRITVKAKSLWSDIILSDGTRYTAPWEKNLADGLGIPYQDFYEETNATGTYQVALFNYEAALTLCAVRGMVLPTIADMNKLHGEKPDPSGSDNWPVARPYWTGEALDSSNKGQVYDLVSGSSALNPMMTPAGVTCVYSGLLAGLETTVDNQYVSGGPTSSTHDEVEALVTTGDGSPLALKNVYFYSSDANLSFSQKQVMTDADGKATLIVDSPVAGTFTVYANYLSQTLNTAVTFIENLVSNLTITGANEVRMGQSINLTASATYDSSDVVDVSTEVSWTSSVPATATVASGVVTGVAPGSVDISASFSGVDAPAHPVTVFSGLSSLVVAPGSAALEIGDTRDLTATAHYDDGVSEDVTTTASWSSSNTTVASVVAGKVTANASGSAVIQASYTDSHGISQVGSAAITVAKVVDHTAISPPSKTFDVADAGIYFKNTVYYKDGTNKDVTSSSTWTSSNSSVASVTTGGYVNPDTVGSTTITARYSENGTTYTATSAVTVNKALTGVTVSPTTASLSVGGTQQMAVTAHYSDSSSQIVTNSGATYASSNTGVATVSNTGLVTAKATGSSSVTATYSEAGVTKSASMAVMVSKSLTDVTVSPTTASLSVNGTQQMAVTAHYNDSSSQIVTTTGAIYVSANTAVATVSATGLVTAKAIGSTSVTATYSEAGVTKSASMAVTVSKALTSITVSPSSGTAFKGSSYNLKVTAWYSDSTQATVTSSAVYTSQNSNVATVDAAGKVSGVNIGSTKIDIAYTENGVTKSTVASVSVLSGAIHHCTLNPPYATVSISTGYYSFDFVCTYEGSTLTTNRTDYSTWSSSDTSVGTVNTSGDVHMLKAGVTTISASYHDSVSGKTFSDTSDLTVTN